jgi:hypothetical protein
LVSVINTERKAERRKKIRDGNWPIYNLYPIRIGGSNHLPTANPTARKDNRPTVGEMISPIVIINFGSAPKLTDP